MEGPTPVSALIHAATMVTAGVFMVARLSPIFELAPRRSKCVVLIVGAITAFFAATVGLVQNDIKRVIAYSTCSQLGYMFVRLRRRRLRRRDVPSVHARVLQGAAVPWRRLGDPRHASRAGHAPHGRAREEDAVHLADDADRHAGADRRRHSACCRFRRLLFQGRHHRVRVCGAYAQQLRVLGAGDRGVHDVVLFVAAHVHDLPRQDARRSSHLRPCARESAGDADPARRSRHRRDVRGLRVPALLHRRGFLDVLGRGALRSAGQGHSSSHARGARVGRLSTDHCHARRPCAVGALLRARAGATRHHRDSVQAALPVPAQQVVLRRAL